MIFVHETDFRNLILNFFHFWSSSNRKFIQISDAAIVRNQESDFNAIALAFRFTVYGISGTGNRNIKPKSKSDVFFKKFEF